MGGEQEHKITNMSHHRINVHNMKLLLQATFPRKMIISE